MNKVKLIVDVAQQVLKVVEDLRSLSDSVQVVCNTVLEGLSEEPKAKALTEKKAEPTISLEKVRGVLAGKSQAGYSAEVRAIVSKYGASRLSDIDSKDYDVYEMFKTILANRPKDLPEIMVGGYIGFLF